LYGRDFVLLRLGPEAPESSPFTQAAGQIKMPLQVVALREPEVLERYGRRLVLVRPDGHVAWRGNEIPLDAGALIDRVRGAAA
jgi:hypothetical protein